MHFSSVVKSCEFLLSKNLTNRCVQLDIEVNSPANITSLSLTLTHVTFDRDQLSMLLPKLGALCQAIPEIWILVMSHTDRHTESDQCIRAHPAYTHKWAQNYIQNNFELNTMQDLLNTCIMWINDNKLNVIPPV